ncbi:hypothetical protein [Emcibacter nanhaiensis]|uniref:Uncharacterized protein n=1 Tax=Emcibacter nanhaiensis TaxID=1505037 RepID=A0A501PNE4_9PROT|nr:hypothetical protein [Emcibacter nanhaiensis]TPD61959.1 hypothetical protein FIV46_07075 [Emcibacter nanhaiensis]
MEEQLKDAVQLASQTGRLDFVSSLLAAISLLTIFGGIFAFLNLRSNAKKTAEKVATEIAEQKAEEIANKYMQDNIGKIIEDYSEFIENHVNASVADQIAQAQEGGENGR